MTEHPGWRSPLHAIRSRISAATKPQPYRDASFRTLDAIQFHPPEVQLDALFVTGVAMALVVGLDPHEMVTRAKRMLPDVESFSDQVAAATDYAKNELKR